jgi:dTDP-4-dehydrorhamnose reductase/SAM-dependent methyltransferase
VILVLGASGIVGQYLRLTQPENVSVVYTSMRQSLPRDFPLRLQTEQDIEILLDRWAPSTIINLTGENRPDIVERDPDQYAFINIRVPLYLAEWCAGRGRRLIHVSTQGVLGGTRAPYSAPTYRMETAGPVNAYGRQKREAEDHVLNWGGLVARLTFVLGVRPFPHVGRPNPIEQMIADVIQKRKSQQVYDRTFSVCFARDAAEILWELARGPHQSGVVHIGTPGPMNRFRLAQIVAGSMGGSEFGDRDADERIEPVQHDVAFPPPWAQRPLDTTYAAEGALFHRAIVPGITETLYDWRRRLDYFDVQDRAVEISTFLGVPADPAAARLSLGFQANHAKVAEDFRGFRPDTDARLLEWYRHTDAYIWELTAYHLDKGFNYRGMCQGIIDRLKTTGHHRVLSLGDGVGDFTIQAQEAGMWAVYHDLLGSKTSNFAAFRIARRQFATAVEFLLTGGWEPDFEGRGNYDAVIALDFFEHLTDVEGWARAVYAVLRPGGVFLAQNAFAIGDNEHGGSIPCHLVRNNRFEHDWLPLLEQIGFVDDGGGWRRKP